MIELRTYRGYSKNLKKFIYGGVTKVEKMCLGIGATNQEMLDNVIYCIIQTNTSDWNIPNTFSLIEVDKNSIGQYIGLEDKNEKMMYEGDICKVDSLIHLTGVIKYNKDGYRLAFNDLLQPSCISECVIRDMIEVIGNEYENSDLLKIEE